MSLWEILNNLGWHCKSIKYFTKAYNIDPENIHILIKSAIAYYICTKYEVAAKKENTSLTAVDQKRWPRSLQKEIQ